MTDHTPFLRPEDRAEAQALRQESGNFSAPRFWIAWYSIHFLLIVATVLVIFCSGWEYSTGRYLKGFANAVVPESASEQGKIQAILDWLSYGPVRHEGDDSSLLSDRDPTETLNHTRLLRACGTATNAFINLADAGGLRARRLLLLDSNGLTKHVVAEVFVDGRWIVVDPAFHRILEDSHGKPLTQQELAAPAIWAAATKNIPGYDADYTYTETAHVRLARLAWIGRPLGGVLDRLAPRWEDSWLLSLVLERESLAGLAGSMFLLLVACVACGLMRRFGESRLGMREVPPAREEEAISLGFSRG